jgi:hypothetical protein
VRESPFLRFSVFYRSLRLPCFLLIAAAACGKAGPPLPPLVRVPSAPAELVAERRGARVDLRFTVPNTNSDGSRPANENHVDVYAITSADPVTDDEIIRRGTRVGRFDVKAPRDPDKAVEADESAADVEPPTGRGLDQGALAHLTESLTEAVFAPAEPPRSDQNKQKRASSNGGERPLLGPAAAPLSRMYVAVGFSTRGRKGLPSKRATVPLVSPPPPPEAPSITYSETAVTVTWKPVTLRGMVQQPDSGDVLPSTPIGVLRPDVVYHVYDVSNPDADAAANKLTATPAQQPTYTDSRITWGQRRCYTVRAVATINSQAIEGDASPPHCETLVDTFAPAAPKNLQAVPNERSISLIWDPNPEKDLAGYLVFRGAEGAGAAQQITPRPIEEARFNDPVPAGVRYRYVVKAIDKAGNLSADSAPASATAR